MRLIVACTSCTRQYDAKGRPVGSRFHCHCGEILTVQQPKGHDASVIRCASCGGARSPGDQSCGYCHASFTLHERDLHTICPSCMARISDKASFCHHCGASIHAEASKVECTQKSCPVCFPGAQAKGEGAKLNHRLLGEQMLPILECVRCAGMWISRSAFGSLEQDAAALGRTFAAKLGPDGAPMAEDDISLAQKAQGPMYRKCPECDVIMHRQNYGRISGIIIDVCKDHGLWFDGHELEAILRWVKGGGLERSAQKDELRMSEERRRLKQQVRDAGAVNSMMGTKPLGINPQAELGNVVFEFAWRALRGIFR